jgi:hypothetical protein
MARKLISTGCVAALMALALAVSAAAMPGSVNATSLGATCAQGGEFFGPHWVWRNGDPNVVGYGCVFVSDDATIPWTAQARRAEAICTAAGWNYYDFGNGNTGLYGYYGWGCDYFSAGP